MAGGIYVHIPYCTRKCIYCDFYSIGSRHADWHLLVDRLLEEYEQRCAAGETLIEPRTLYIGGGTPSLMPQDELKRLVEGLYAPSMTEVTIEVNPDDVTPQKAHAWREMGINRISMGVQSFNDLELKAIGRRHDSAGAFKAYEILRPIFHNISIDLIFGLPGQTLQSWQESLQQAIDLRPEHISAYSLMYEQGTALTHLRDSGHINEAPEQLICDMFDLLRRSLLNAGYEHYEISNFALPGRRSLHNGNYWKGLPYIGLGPSAHSFDGRRTRSWNAPDAASYLKGEFGRESETLTDTERMEEIIMTRLRTCEGIDLKDYAEQFGEEQLQTLLHRAQPLITSGHLTLIHAPLSLPGNITSDPGYTTPGHPSMESPYSDQWNGYLRLTPAALLTSDVVILQLT